VDLLTTGVDVPVVRNICFFKYVKSPIAFYQMLGRGTRLHPPTDKLMFRVYDFTDATRLFNKEFVTRFQPRKPGGGGEPPPEPPEPTIQVEGFDVRVTHAGHYIVTQVDGQTRPVTVEEYRALVAAKLIEEAATLDDFRKHWIVPRERRELLGHLPDGGRSALVIQKLDHKEQFDLYAVLAEVGYGMAGKTRSARAQAFSYKHEAWLVTLPPESAATLRAMAAQFASTGTDALESPAIFQTPEVVAAGGLAALKALGKPAEVLRDTKARMFAA
jgi:type I restriction enzyme R subunit